MKADVLVTLEKTVRVVRVDRREKWIELEASDGKVIRAYVGQPLTIKLTADLHHG